MASPPKAWVELLASWAALDFEQTPICLRLVLPSDGAGEPDQVIVLGTVPPPQR